MTRPDPAEDPYAWLEDVEGEEALAWVRARNDEKAAELARDDRFAATRKQVRAILDSDDKIPHVVQRGDHLYNFWTDARHERGIWRRTTWESYRTDSPEWETVLDVDALGEEEGEKWVWGGATVLRGEGPDAYRWAMVDLSRGGADASVSREFDLQTCSFVDDGFVRPEAKGGVGWVDHDTLLVFTDFGEGTMSSSGYPRQVRRWRRGTPLDRAELLYEGEAEDMYVAGLRDDTPGFERTIVLRMMTFYTNEMALLDDETGELAWVPVPPSAEAQVYREHVTVDLREDWQVGERTFVAGSLLIGRLDDLLAGEPRFEVAFEPTPTASLAAAQWTRHHLVLTVLDDVKNRIEVLTPQADGTLRRTPASGLPAVGEVSVRPVDPQEDDRLWILATGFLTPTTLALTQLDEHGRFGGVEPLKAAPAHFDTEGLVAEQHFVTSDDGTRVPYFLVRRSDVPLDGTTPTLLYAYGGFEVSLTPGYSGVLGTAWLEQGGAYALANIRGGGEYGPAWHQAALRENRHRAYEDLAAVARDLADRGVTSPRHLGVRGGSNGGLLTGNMLVSYPELFGAVVIEVPLLDMARYSHLLAGASWVAEYGDPDVPEDWEFLRTFSPYHLLEEGRTYPPVLLTTSTRDDRVHPGHARKMTARLLELGQDVTYYENIEGGHGGAATNDQAAHLQALAYTFLRSRLEAPTG